MRNLVLTIVLATVLSSHAAAAPRTAEEAEAIRVRRIDLAGAQLEQAMMTRNETAAQLSAVRRQVRDQTGLVEVAPEAIRQMIAKLQEQRESLELDGAGAAGRRKGLDEAVAELSSKLKDRAQADPVADELSKVVEVRQKQLSRLQALKSNAAVSQEEVDTAAANLATARADVAVAQRKASGSASASAEVLDAWNRQRLELSVSEQERRARLEFIAKRLAAFSAALNRVDQLEEFRMRLDQTDRLVIKAQDELEVTKRTVEWERLEKATKGAQP